MINFFQTENIRLKLISRNDKWDGVFCILGKCFPIEEDSLEDCLSRCREIIERQVKVEVFDFWREVSAFTLYLKCLDSEPRPARLPLGINPKQKEGA